MNLYEKILKKEEKVAVIDLDYIGIPLAVVFAKRIDGIGFDLNEKRLNYIRRLD